MREAEEAKANGETYSNFRRSKRPERKFQGEELQEVQEKLYEIFDYTPPGSRSRFEELLDKVEEYIERYPNNNFGRFLNHHKVWVEGFDTAHETRPLENERQREILGDTFEEIKAKKNNETR